MDLTYGAQKFFADDALHNVSPRTCVHRAVNLLLTRMRGEYQDACVREFANQSRRAVDPAHSRESKVHHHQAWMIFAVSLQRGLTAACFGHHSNVRLDIQRRKETRSEEHTSE